MTRHSLPSVEESSQNWETGCLNPTSTSPHCLCGWDKLPPGLGFGCFTFSFLFLALILSTIKWDNNIYPIESLQRLNEIIHKKCMAE